MLTFWRWCQTTSGLAVPWMLCLSLYILSFLLGAPCSYKIFLLKFLSTHKAIFPSTSFFLFVCEFSEDKGLKQWSLGTHLPNSSLLIIQLLNSFRIWKVTLANVSYSPSLSALQMHDTFSISFLVYHLTFLSKSSFITLCLFPAYKVTMNMGITFWSQTILPINFEMPLLDLQDIGLWCSSNPGLGIHTDIMQSEITCCNCCLATVTTEVLGFALRALGSHQSGCCGLLYSCCAI